MHEINKPVSEELQSKPRLRVGLPSRGTSALARESMGEPPMPLSNTPFYNPLKQRAVTPSGLEAFKDKECCR
jgi:hypothetical protein